MSASREIRGFLETVGALSGLGQATLDAIGTVLEEVDLASGAYLFRFGEPADALFFLREGMVSVTPPGMAGLPAVIVSAPAIIGEGALLGAAARFGSARATSEVHLLQLTRARLAEIGAHADLLRARLQSSVGPHHTLLPEGDPGIERVGHRDYVGGMWDDIGRLQFDLMVAHGLKPETYLLDIGCGPLRGGVHFIHYLEPGRYLGMDKEPRLLKLGIEQELGQEIFERKRPQLIASASFEFDRFDAAPQMSLAQSLFTHLVPDDIRACLTRLRHVVSAGHPLLASFFEGSSGSNPERSHSWAAFVYATVEMEQFAAETGWDGRYLGTWGHPRGQRLFKFSAR